MQALSRIIPVGLLLIGLAMRLAYARTDVFHTDEFISMLAIRMIAENGLPILPSGLFYDHGILYTYTAGAMVWLVDFHEWIARWPVILLSTTTIAVYYQIGRRLFNSPATGLVAAAFFTFDLLAIKWGVWARMYTMAHLFALLMIAWLLISTVQRPSPRGRYLFLLFMTLALLSHSLTLFLLPPLALLALIALLIHRRDWLTQPEIWLQTLLGAAILGGVLWLVSQGHVGSTVSLRDPYADVPPPFGLEFLRGFFLPSLEWARFEDFLDFYDETTYSWLLPLILIALAGTLYRLWRGDEAERPRHLTLLLLMLLPLLVITEMATLLTDDWRKDIYMYFLTLPAFILVGAESLTRCLRWLAMTLLTLRERLTLPPNIRESAIAAVGVLVILLLMAYPAWDEVRGQATGDYHTAFPFIREQWQAGDRVMAGHAAAAYLYLDRNDYYLNPINAKVLEDERGIVDRYAGSPLLETVTQFNDALSRGERVWFVVGRNFMDEHYENLLQQQIFSQMDIVRQAGEKYVLVSRPFPQPVPLEPDTLVDDANFDNMVALAGYSLDTNRIAPDGVTQLGLYWRPLGDVPPSRLKVFVQLRDGDGQTISQADHFIFEGLLSEQKWRTLRDDGEWLRDTADLAVPLPLDNGPYQVYVGFYHPETFERVPLLRDESGENAVIIPFPEP